MNKTASIIIRTKNEERWITQCLHGVFEQEYKDFEVILVDNESEDKTLEKAGQFNLAKVLSCREYMPGRALNIGIRESKGDYIVCLSGHCIPVNSTWLGNLLKGLDDRKVAGVYGRQEPMSFTPDSDKRDLTLVFGLDRKVQQKDSFFHNANSAMRKETWRKYPFDEAVTNIEDRVWAKKVLEQGYRIIYEPGASVYHYHGIHQNSNEQRCANVVKIMEKLHHGFSAKPIDIERMNITAIIPVKGEARYIDKAPLIEYTIRRAKESKYIKEVIVSTDSAETGKIAEKLGARVPFRRDESFSEENVDLAQVLKYTIGKIEEARIFPDLVVLLEVTFPFRPEGLLDDMIARLAEGGFDSVVAAKKENKAIWQQKDGVISQIEEGITPRQFKEPTYIELKGVGCVTHPEFLREGKLLGDKVGIYELDNPYSHLEVRSEDDFRMAASLIKEMFKA
ncbi:MAG: glycosyltransferase [Candidatus Omnitrophica bacterium]|nr:glycosyltransferase [Candidatus Omnitrophota bacterium]MDD5736846.1 glycosyltransferase [Candidatus Omnitrophota bacterium]